ncbi:MAG: HD domain-containing protein, partial [Firmicutes bacterium]|nr:HD domain-containing protein [Bacillota bacterium]
GGAEMIKHHHERWDGTGYPDGLKGEFIPEGARILAVADAFDAMTSDRSYREALGYITAVQIIEEGAGTQFDPHMVEIFIQLISRFNLEDKRESAGDIMNSLPIFAESKQ